MSLWHCIYRMTLNHYPCPMSMWLYSSLSMSWSWSSITLNWPDDFIVSINSKHCYKDPYFHCVIDDYFAISPFNQYFCFCCLQNLCYLQCESVQCGVNISVGWLRVVKRKTWMNLFSSATLLICRPILCYYNYNMSGNLN